MKTRTLVAICLLAAAASAGNSIRQASVYSTKYNGRKTANGEIYRHWAVSCASNQHKFGTVVTVTVLTGKYRNNQVSCKVNDRLARSMSYRIDLSGGAMKEITNGAYTGDRTPILLRVGVKP